MKKLTLHIVFLFLSLGSLQMLLSQGTTLNSNGRINNSGTIRIKAGQVKLNQDTIHGRVEFLQKDVASQQAIPNMVFHQLILRNTAKKIVRDSNKDLNNKTRPLIIMDSLVIEDSANFTTQWIGWLPEDIQARATVKNNASYKGPKFITMNNQTKKQDLEGKGAFSNLNILNPYGVDVTSGGFTITDKLALTNGQLRNSTANNFKMGDSSLIIRNVSGSLVSEPEFVGVVSVQYTGTGDIIAAEEIPTDGKTLKSLYVENQGTLNLSKNTLVNDSLIIKANIITGNDTLELKSRNNPLFDFANFNLEIQGNFKRSAVIPGDSIILNNPWTWVRFGSTADLGQIKAITSTILPSQFQPYFEGTEKVKRLINLSVYNESGSSLNTGFKGQFGYSWRHNPGNLNDESNGLNPEELVLQRWDGNGWLNLPSSIPITDYPLAWSYANTDSFDTAGFFAIGNANISGLMFRAFALLEGPYIPNSQKYMTTELWKRNLIRNADINAYPLNLITDIASMLPKTIPDSVVDFAVLEFRKDRNGDAIFRKPIFFKYDGRLVDLFGSERIKINDTSAINVAGGDYYVVIRHRNHAPVITQEPLRIIKENNTLVYNFNDPKLIEGGTTTLKLVDYVDNKRIYAIKGGFIPYSNADIVNMMNITMYYTNPVFWEESWKKFTNIGYINTDYNLSGIVNTKDFNISWNNRGK